MGGVALLCDQSSWCASARPVAAGPCWDSLRASWRPDDDAAARRQAELGEKSAIAPGDSSLRPSETVSPGYCTERIHVFLGLELELVEAHPEASEEIERVELSVDTPHARRRPVPRQRPSSACAFCWPF